MFGLSDGDAREKLLKAPLNPQQAAMANSGTPSSIRQQELGGGFTSLPRMAAAPATYWQKMKMMEAATLMRYLRYANVVLAVLQALAGFLGLFNLVVLDITCFLISVYAISLFALLLLAFECRFKHMEPWIRQQFGFLFTYRGRTAFIFCVGFMDFGMEGSLPFAVGALMCANAALSLLIMLFHPQFREGTLAATMDPTATYRPAAEETETLLREHQGVAAKAGAFVLHEAEDHPEFMAKVRRAGISTAVFELV
ncbi:hypothetical protein BBJ28_00017914 [Nothophytophthora sp. Chile5]|nr:hypothetical protein BBJ28_00017914 [Nothophytophthora sp. Chile5]